MPLNDYRCGSCGFVTEVLTTKVSDVVDYVECPECGYMAEKNIGRPNIRMGKLFTAGGKSIEDKDGFESLGLTGDQAEESTKKYRDAEQAKAEGKDMFQHAVEQSPSREISDDEMYEMKHRGELD